MSFQREVIFSHGDHLSAKRTFFFRHLPTLPLTSLASRRWLTGRGFSFLFFLKPLARRGLKLSFQPESELRAKVFAYKSLVA